jgi:hypothetical protein
MACRAVTALVVMVLVMSATAACTGSATPGTLTATTQVAPDRASVVRLPGGVSASIPKGGVWGAGSLVATLVPRPAPIPDGLLQAGAVYEFAVTGTHLAAPVTITLPAPSDPAGPATAVLGYYSAGEDSAGEDSASQTTAGSWTLVPSVYSPQTRAVSGRVNIDALSGTAWAAIQLDSGQARNEIQDQILDDLGIAGQPRPSCPAQYDNSKNIPNAPVEWCVGTANGHPVLRVTNNRNYAIAAAYPAAWSVHWLRPLDAVTRQAMSIVAASTVEAGTVAASTAVAGTVEAGTVEASTAVAGTAASTAANTAGAVPARVREVILPGGQSVEFDSAAAPRTAAPRAAAPGTVIPPGANAVFGPVTLGPSNSGYLVTAISLAVAAFSASYGDVPGAPHVDPARSARAVSRAFATSACRREAGTSGSSAGGSSEGDGSTAFASLDHDANLALNCLRPAWQAEYGTPGSGPAPLRPFLAGVADWTVRESSQLLSGLRLLAASMIAWPPVVVHVA